MQQPKGYVPGTKPRYVWQDAWRAECVPGEREALEPAAIKGQVQADPREELRRLLASERSRVDELAMLVENDDTRAALALARRRAATYAGQLCHAERVVLAALGRLSLPKKQKHMAARNCPGYLHRNPPLPAETWAQLVELRADVETMESEAIRALTVSMNLRWERTSDPSVWSTHLRREQLHAARVPLRVACLKRGPNGFLVPVKPPGEGHSRKRLCFDGKPAPVIPRAPATLASRVALADPAVRRIHHGCPNPVACGCVKPKDVDRPEALRVSPLVATAQKTTPTLRLPATVAEARAAEAKRAARPPTPGESMVYFRVGPGNSLTKI